MSNLVYLANYNILFDSCDFIIITNTDADAKIVKILDCSGKKNNIIETDMIECKVHKEHKIGENINIMECELFPNDFKIFQAPDELFTYLSTVGNRSAWAGYPLQLLSDEDGELYCVFNSDDGISYSGWVATHKHAHLGYPRSMTLESINNEKIEVIVDKIINEKYPDYGQLIVKYQDNQQNNQQNNQQEYIEYAYYKGEQVPEVMSDIEHRLSAYIP
jgi:hypothetical protein